MARYRLVESPSVIPAPGGKLIEELMGRVNTGTEAFSLAHMVAPPGWREPAQRPTFGELTIMIRGTMRIEIGQGDAVETVDLRAGQAFWVEPDVRVRYENPFAEENEYYAVCLPAFAPDAARREPE
ncbi:cupin domain-containing protein [Haliangium sp.]|uniref:cupin domain-containing protein n=1 Tax=Haliangium sp. TaxID=2663208 RepID=UPI003D138007